MSKITQYVSQTGAPRIPAFPRVGAGGTPGGAAPLRPGGRRSPSDRQDNPGGAGPGRRRDLQRVRLEFRGRLIESAVGAHLANAAAAGACDLFYWRERNREVDFVLRAGKTVIAIEVKSGRSPEALPGLDAFAATFKPRRTLIVGAGGIPLEEFLGRPVEDWLTA
ncbi:MAG TPA: DUF4143 domain-containing protein [Candidatus Polarisedimenticolia bacterium]|nr:DUF4143 domain-containing protein [Candidatus Polarisedimenticolia bacterium]